MEGAQPWPDLGASCLTAHTLAWAWRVCLSPPAPAWSQAALSHPLVLALHTCTCAFLPHSTSGQSCCAPLGECPGLQKLSRDSSKHQALAKPHLSYICDLVSQMGLGSSTPWRACMPLLDPGPWTQLSPIGDSGSWERAPCPWPSLGPFPFLPAT